MITLALRAVKLLVIAPFLSLTMNTALEKRLISIAIIRITMRIFTIIGKFNPGWKFTAFMMIILPILFGLSFWQYQRGLEKSKLESFINNQQTLPPTEYISLEYTAPSQWYKPFYMQGTFRPKVILIDNAIFEGSRGYSVYQEFKPIDGESLIVSRGWTSSFDEPLINQNKDYFLQGIFRPIEKAFFLDNQVNQTSDNILEMQTFDIDTINKEWSTSYPAVVFELDEFSMEGFTRIWQPVYLKANRHFGYAVQWLGLALVALTGFIFVGFKAND